MNAKVLEYLIRGNSNDFVAAVGNAKTTHQQAIENMTAAARRLELFGKAQADAKQTASEFFKLKNETAAYQTALAAARAAGRLPGRHDANTDGGSAKRIGC
ncbi:hypothetical protein JOS77_14045 [Chromobacterium haemolyticum]|nr:hypothetical protein JOS77_14045 [Chromobacterium haemolyticum]